MKANLFVVKLAAFAVCVLLATKSLGGPVYEYDWVGGQSGFHGQIFLDAPTSASAPQGGTYADVLGGSLTTPLGTFPIYDPAVSSSFFVPLGWDQTHISLMDLFFEPTSQIINPAYGLPAIGQAQVNFQGVQNGLETSVLPLNGGTATAFLFDDFSGQWLAVPEPSVLALGIFGLASSLFCRRGLRVICFCFLIAETPRRRGSETQSTEPPENHSDHPVKNDAFEKLLDAKFPPDTDVMAKAMTTTDSF